MGEGWIFLKNLYRMSLISAWSISLDSTFKGFMSDKFELTGIAQRDLCIKKLYQSTSHPFLMWRPQYQEIKSLPHVWSLLYTRTSPGNTCLGLRAGNNNATWLFLHFPVLSWNFLYCPAISCTVLHFLYCPPLSCTVLNFPALSCNFHTILHFPSMSCTFLQCPALSFNVLHFPVLSCNFQHCPALSWDLLHGHKLSCICSRVMVCPLCLGLSYTVMGCPTLSWAVLHCHGLPLLFLYCHKLFQHCHGLSCVMG